MRLLLDTDIGSDIDDAVALAYLLAQPRCELVGVTTVSGRPEVRAELVSAICRNAGRNDIPIFPGAGQSLLGASPQPDVPQAAALGDWSRQRQFPVGQAIEFMRRTIRENPGRLTLLAIGPLTNVALLFAADPQAAAMLKALVLMCGRFFDTSGRGAEWNARCDPHAAAIVYGAASRPGPPVHISFGLDVTTQCRLEAGQCRRRFGAAVLAPVRDFAEVFFETHDAITFHDPLAAACVFVPDICRYRRGRIGVSLAEDDAGATGFGPEQAAPHTAADEVDPAAFFEHYFETVGG